MMKNKIIILLSAFMIALPSWANAASCYNAAQLEAEQGLRIHSELMVIALNCTQIQPGLNKQYENFTKANFGLIQGYEDTIKSVFRADGIADPEAEINGFRTQLANRIAGEAIRLQPNVFCRAYGDRIAQAINMPREKFRKWAKTVFPGYPLTRPVCDGVDVKTQNR